MTECGICYLDRSKVTLECSHQLCLVCLMKIISKVSLKCPFCRRVYEYEYEKKKVRWVVSIAEGVNPYNQIIESRLYNVTVNETENIEKFDILIITKENIHNDMIKNLIQLLFDIYPIRVENIRRQITYSNYLIRPANHYLEEYYDIIMMEIVMN